MSTSLPTMRIARGLSLGGVMMAVSGTLAVVSAFLPGVVIHHPGRDDTSEVFISYIEGVFALLWGLIALMVGLLCLRLGEIPKRYDPEGPGCVAVFLFGLHLMHVGRDPFNHRLNPFAATSVGLGVDVAFAAGIGLCLAAVLTLIEGRGRVPRAM